ncbi:MAG: glycosyltransferase family 4 protein [Ilumatobacter sp.]|nr:glycosyltransferase family 4 protein [Ilumatobacter sp.]
MTDQLVHPGDPGNTRLAAVGVAVNLLWCVPGQVGGSEEYLVRQLTGLAAQRSEFLPTLYVVPAFVDAHPDLAEVFPIAVAGVSGSDRPRRVLAEHTWLRRRTRSAELVHHGGGTVPAVGTRPALLTIHDLQYLSHPEYASRRKLRYLRRMVPRSVRRAAVVATPSEWVRATVIDSFGVDAERVVVVPHGVEATIGADAPSEFELRRDYGLGAGRVVVFPAITHPHKGHEFLLDVMARHWDDPDLRLVLLGGAGSADRQVEAKIAALGLDRRIVRPGRVPATHRDGLIALADALVFPSEYEGFGAPVVEAMALGTPVIAADQPAVVEVLGDAGIVVARDLDAWAGVLETAVDRRAELIALGRRRALEYTAVKSGAALAAAYRRALQ